MITKTVTPMRIEKNNLLHQAVFANICLQPGIYNKKIAEKITSDFSG
jgi:hypothetical protein